MNTLCRRYVVRWSSSLPKHRVSRYESLVLRLTGMTKGPVTEVRYVACFNLHLFYTSILFAALM